MGLLVMLVGSRARSERLVEARLRCPWAVAGRGRESKQRAQPHISDPAPQVWRAPEGPEGTGGLRGAVPNEVRPPSLAGGRALRRPEHPWGHTASKTAETQRKTPAQPPSFTASQQHSQKSYEKYESFIGSS